MTLLSCSNGQNFSQFPGFVAFFKQYPPKPNPPNAAEIALLERYQPAVYLAENQPQPVDFYQDYIAHGELFAGGKKISSAVTPALLNQYVTTGDAVFKYKGDFRQPGTAKVYARIDYDLITHAAESYEFTFLSYNLVFPVSGVLQGLGALQSLGLTIVGNLDDWHQLDHYVGLTVALINQKPVALALQQHNYQTTYLLTDDQSIAVDIAMRSNELYPHNKELVKHPAVSFVTKNNLEFIVTGKNKPLMAGYDITHGEKQIDYQLEYLPQTDAFYQFQGSLGTTRLLPGRSGPPGADYVTLPGLMPRFIRLVTGYRPGSAEQEAALNDALFDHKTFSIREDALQPYIDRFFQAITVAPQN